MSMLSLTPNQRRVVTWGGMALGLSLVVWLLGPVLMPFIVASVLAYALHPAVEWLVVRRVPRALAVLGVETLALLTLLALVLLLVPILAKQIPLLREQIPVLAVRVNELLAPLLAKLGVTAQLDVASIKAFVLKHVGDNAEELMGTALSSARIGGSVVLALVGNAILIPTVLFFLLMDWPDLVRRLTELVPPRLRDKVQSFASECDELLGQYMRGQLLVMLALAAYYTILLAVFGFSLALPVGVFTGLAIAIPYLGFGLGFILALLAGLLQFPGSWYGPAVVMGVYAVGQLLESLLLTPRLVGERIGLTPLAVIFALLAFGQLFGFIGVLIALPLSAVTAVAIRRARNTYMQSDLFHGP